MDGAMMAPMNEGSRQDLGAGWEGEGFQETMRAFSSFGPEVGGERGNNSNPNKNWGLFLVLLFGLVFPFLHFFVPLLSSEGFEATRLRDDAAYQFVVARNLASGSGFTFDGVHVASGVQVLWTLLLSAITKVFGQGALPLLSMLLGVFLFLGTLFLAFRLFVRFFGPRIALLLSAFMASRGLVFAEVMNGQETALGLFALFLFADWAFPREEDSNPRSFKLRFLVILLPWIRTDLLVFPLGLALWPGLADRFGLPARETRSAWVDLCLSLGVYLLGNRLLFGVFLPPSSFALPSLFRDNFIAGQPGFGAWVQQIWWFLRPLFLGSPFLIAGILPAMGIAWWLLAPLARRQKGLPLFLVFFAFLLGGANLSGLLLGALLLSVGLLPSRTQQLSFAGESASASLLAFFGLAALHLVLRWYPRDYYFVSLLLPGLLCLGLLLHRWTSDEGLLAFIPKNLRERIAYGLLLVLGLSGSFPLGARFPWQEEMRFAGRWLNQVLPDKPPLGSFNAGWIAWEYQGRVTNLDGCVDGASLPALRQKRLLTWLQDQGTDLLVDSWREFADKDPDTHNPHASGRFLGPLGSKELVPLIAIDLPGVGGRHPGTDSLVLCKIKGSLDPDFPNTPRILGRDKRGRPVLLVPRSPQGYRIEVEIHGAKQGRHFLKFGASVDKAPFLLTRIPGKKGKVFLPGGKVLDL